MGKDIAKGIVCFFFFVFFMGEDVAEVILKIKKKILQSM